MVNQSKLYTIETLEFFFEDDIMLKRFMEYFDDFKLEVDFKLYKNTMAKRLITDGVPDTEIAKKLDMTYVSVWKIKDRLLKGSLSNYANGE